MAILAIEVDAEAADAYLSAPADAQKKVQLLLNIWLPTLRGTGPSLQEIMDKMSDEAEANGLTDELLESLLNERR